MGIYYTNYIYYGYIMRKAAASKCNLTSNLQLMKMSDERFILYSKLKAIDDGVKSINSIPDSFNLSSILDLNKELDKSTFVDNLFTEELQASIAPLYAKPEFYVVCVQVTTLEEKSIGNVLYNIRVNLST